MSREYTLIMKQHLKCESASKTFQKLLEEEIYEYKAIKAYVVIDNARTRLCDRRQVKWAKKYLKSHNIRFQEIKAYVDKAWEQDAKLYSELYAAFDAMHPGLTAFFGEHMMY